MYLKNTLYGQSEWERSMPLIDPGSSASLLAGAALLYGTTTNHQGLIRGTGALADFAGVLKKTVASASFGTVAAGTLAYEHVTLDNGVIWMAEWDQSTITSNDVSSSTSTATTFTTTQVDDSDGGYMYIVSGTGSGQLRYIGAATTTVLTVGTSMAWTTTPDTTSDVAIILAAGTQLVDVITNATKFKAENATYTGRVAVLANYIKHDAAGGLMEMKPSTHGTLDNLSNAAFFCEFTATNTWWNKID